MLVRNNSHLKNLSNNLWKKEMRQRNICLNYWSVLKFGLLIRRFSRFDERIHLSEISFPAAHNFSHASRSHANDRYALRLAPKHACLTCLCKSTCQIVVVPLSFVSRLHLPARVGLGQVIRPLETASEMPWRQQLSQLARIGSKIFPERLETLGKKCLVRSPQWDQFNPPE